MIRKKKFIVVSTSVFGVPDNIIPCEKMDSNISLNVPDFFGYRMKINKKIPIRRIIKNARRK